MLHLNLGSGGALDAAIAGAFAKKKPIFTYYWAPTGLMGKVDLVRLTEPKFDSDCWNSMSAVVEDIKANGPDAYKKSCACTAFLVSIWSVCFNIFNNCRHRIPTIRIKFWFCKSNKINFTH